MKKIKEETFRFFQMIFAIFGCLCWALVALGLISIIDGKISVNPFNIIILFFIGLILVSIAIWMNEKIENLSNG